MSDYYFAFKAFHIISVIAWMATLFYLPRLFLYHAKYYDNASFRDIVAIQERKLYYFIGYPAMIATIISGSLLASSLPGLFSGGGWIHAKILFVACMAIYHFTCGLYRKRLLEYQCHTEQFFKIFNEIPTILMIVIVILVVIKPF